MNILPLELSSLSSVFRIPLSPDAFSASIEVLARLHALRWSLYTGRKTGWFEQAFLDESSFLEGYGRPEAATERQRTQAFLDQVRSTPGLALRTDHRSFRSRNARHTRQERGHVPIRAWFETACPFGSFPAGRATLIYTDASGNLSPD